MSEESEEKISQEEQWNQQRQELDQKHSVERKQWTSERGSMQGQLTQAQVDVQTLKSQLDSLTVEREQFKKLDPENADVPDVIARQEKMIKKLSDAEKELVSLRSLASDMQEQAKSNLLADERKRVIDKICIPLDQQYGVKYRNEAKKMADDLVDTGQEKVDDQLDARNLIERCYKQLSDADKKKASKKKTPTDNGGGGSTAKTTDNMKESSMAETMTDMRKGLWAKIKEARLQE